MLHQLKRLAKHSAIYGLGGLVSRVLAILLLPLYTRYLSPSDYGAIETLVAASAVLVTLLRAGISSAFFRFYFDAEDDTGRTRVVRTAFWFTMTMSTAALIAGLAVAGPISQLLFSSGDRAGLVRAAFIGLWAQMNFEQITSLFRVEERSLQFAVASISNVLITIVMTIVLVVGFNQHALGVIVGNFIGTLAVYIVLLAYRRYQLGLEFDRRLLREMNRFGLPLVPAAIFLWGINFSDRLFLVRYVGQDEVGLYSIGVRLASAIVFLQFAFRTAWPAFAYSIKSDDEAKQTYAWVLTYLVLITCWISLALGVLSPWLARLLTKPEFYGGARVVSLLAFAGVAFTAYTVVAIGVGRARKTQFNWVVTGVAAALNIGMNFVLVPRYGMIGAAISTAAAYSAMFVLMTLNAQRVFPAPYQWRRVATAAGVAVALDVTGEWAGVGLGVAVALVIAYPVALGALGFYSPGERRRIAQLARRFVPAR